MNEFKTRRWPLFQALKAATAIINKKGSLPIIESVAITTIKKRHYLIATDLEVTYHQQIDFEGKKADINIVFEPIPVMKFLESIPKNIEELVVTIKDNNLMFQAGFDDFTIGLYEFKDFPETRELDDPMEVSIDRIELHNALKSAFKFTSTDELRPVMTGVYLDLKTEDGPFVVATDAHRLFRQRFKGTLKVPEDSDLSIIIPKKAITAMDKILDTDVSNQITLTISKDRSHLKISDLEERRIVYARLIDGTYPNWRAVIPTDRDKVCSLHVSDLTGRLNMAQSVSSANGGCALAIRYDKLYLKAVNVDYARTYNANFDIKSTAEINLGVNSFFMAECLASVGTDIVYMYFSQPNRAIIITKAKTVDPDEDIFLLLMPVMSDTVDNSWDEPKTEVIESELLLDSKSEPKKKEAKSKE